MWPYEILEVVFWLKAGGKKAVCVRTLVCVPPALNRIYLPRNCRVSDTAARGRRVDSPSLPKETDRSRHILLEREKEGKEESNERENGGISG